jgi:two-component system heavy metal sensor histidine kinase CusS
VKRLPRALQVRRSLAVRLAIASALFGLVVAVGAVLVGFWTLLQQLDERAALQVQGRRELLVHILATLPNVATVPQSQARFDELFYGHDDLHLALVEPGSGRVLATSSELATHSLTALGHSVAKADTVHSWITPDNVRFSGIHGAGRVADGAEVEFFLSVDRRHDGALLAGFIKSSLLALPLLLLLVALGAGLVTRMGLAPLRRLNKVAASVGTRSLDQRLSVAGLPAELAEVAVEFNRMLQRIDDGYRQLQDFAGDLAHEMRTPVGTLIGRSQVALSQARSAGELREVLEGNHEELERLARLISDMLFLAQADHEAVKLQPQPVNLLAEAQRVVDYMSVVAEEKDVTLRIEGAAPEIQADRLLVQRAITNLLSNAVRHASADSGIELLVAQREDRVMLSVTNHGETIAPEHLERIFERFWRGDAGRARREGGTGLGLAIVRSIMKAHGGTIDVESAAGRTTFTLAFPAEPAPSA